MPTPPAHPRTSRDTQQTERTPKLKCLASLLTAAALTATPSLAQSPDWTGAYAGLQLGFADVSSNLAGTSGDGAITGLTGGYDWDLGAWVVGLGADFDIADIGLGAAAELEEIWRIKFRGGYKIGQGLAYGTAGYAHADTDILGDEDGYFIGAGYERLVAPNFSLGGEVLYHEFDNFNAGPTDIDATTVQVRGTFRF